MARARLKEGVPLFAWITFARTWRCTEILFLLTSALAQHNIGDFLFIIFLLFA